MTILGFFFFFFFLERLKQRGFDKGDLFNSPLRSQLLSTALYVLGKHERVHCSCLRLSEMLSSVASEFPC